MEQRYEYRFERLGEGLFTVKRRARRSYQALVHERAREGWRLVQIFSPGVGVYGASRFYELVFERPVQA